MCKEKVVVWRKRMPPGWKDDNLVCPCSNEDRLVTEKEFFSMTWTKSWRRSPRGGIVKSKSVAYVANFLFRLFFVRTATWRIRNVTCWFLCFPVGFRSCFVCLFGRSEVGESENVCLRKIRSIHQAELIRKKRPMARKKGKTWKM